MAVPAASHERGRRILRPANYSQSTPGFGLYEGTLPSVNGAPGVAYAILNLQGRVFMSACDDPFRKADDLLAQIQRQSAAKGHPRRLPRRSHQ